MVALPIFLAVLGAMSLFQLRLALGAPWGTFVFGGQHAGALPRHLRVASALSVLVYVLFAIFALDASEVTDVFGPRIASIGMWFVVGFAALSIAMNAVSRSPAERYTMTPVSVLLTVLAYFIAR